MELTTQLHLILTSRMSGVLPLLCQYAFMLWTRTSSLIFRCSWELRNQYALSVFRLIYCVYVCMYVLYVRFVLFRRFIEPHFILSLMTLCCLPFLTCFSCSPPDVNLVANQFHILYMCQITTATE